jgi:hypothetical protein
MRFPPWWRARHTATAVFLPTLTLASAALASQGPGGRHGTAGPLTQLVMAIVVYGGAALILAAAIFESLRRKV